MHIFDIMGPVMVGPSSSHTAGAVRIGLISRQLLGGQPESATLLLHGSFAATGKGHGTDRALVSGLLGLQPDDPNIPRGFQLAEDAGMAIDFKPTTLRDAHPNTVLLRLSGNGKQFEISASSLGGGRVRINSIDGLEAAFTGDYPTLIIRNQDRPGQVADVTSALSQHCVNIATMQLYRDRRGGLAVMIIESDHPIPQELITHLKGLSGIEQCTYLNMGEVL